jgi:hypothetical protein
MRDLRANHSTNQRLADEGQILHRLVGTIDRLVEKKTYFFFGL